MEKRQKKATEKGSSTRAYKNLDKIITGKINFRRQFQADYKPYPGEVNNMPSKTVPDQSLTPRQMIANHTRGISVNIKENESLYFDSDIPRFDDITEKIEYEENLIQQLKDVNKIMLKEHSDKKALRKAKKEEDRLKAIEFNKVSETALKTATANDQGASK